MTRLFVTADLHGSLNTWMTLKALMKPSDSLVIAGDLFDTRYGNYSHPDFQPDYIRQEIRNISQTVYYVYGNCDDPLFFPGHGSTLKFNAFEKTFFLHHGHGSNPEPEEADIIISGHTHRWLLERKGSQIFINPGTLTNPRNSMHTYGIIDTFQARILNLRTGSCLDSINL